MSQLVSRVVLAVPLAALVVYATLRGGWIVAIPAAVAAVIASHEFSSLTRNLRPLTPVGLAGAAGVVVAVHEGGIAWATAPLALTLVGAFWLSAVAEVRQSAAVQLAVTTFGVVWIGLGFGFLVAIRDIPAPSGWGRELLLAVLLGVWGSDIAAYGAGRLLGRRKLAEQISPAKTVEGLVAGVIAGTAIVFFTLYHQPHSHPLSPLHALELGLAVAVAAPAGDLFESYLKRDAGVKDTGSLLGAHGGMLDRVDALLWAAPATYFVALAIGRA
ncbi:MAG TPA: phosphatidate cytidylyltransferase [Gaiellales bacterium]